MFPPQPLPNELPPMTAEEAQQLLQGYQEAQENMCKNWFVLTMTMIMTVVRGMRLGHTATAMRLQL